MSNRQAPFGRIELDELFARASGSVTAHGAVSWAADELGVTRQTVHRWLSGDTKPTARQRAQLHIAARAAAIRRERESGQGLFARLLFTERVIEATVHRERERLASQRRANQAFDNADRRVRYRLGHGEMMSFAPPPTFGTDTPRERPTLPPSKSVRTGGR